jgi:hypothetical protein
MFTVKITSLICVAGQNGDEKAYIENTHIYPADEVFISEKPYDEGKWIEAHYKGAISFNPVNLRAKSWNYDEMVIGETRAIRIVIENENGKTCHHIHNLPFPGAFPELTEIPAHAIRN